MEKLDKFMGIFMRMQVKNGNKGKGSQGDLFKTERWSVPCGMKNDFKNKEGSLNASSLRDVSEGKTTAEDRRRVMRLSQRIARPFTG